MTGGVITFSNIAHAYGEKDRYNHVANLNPMDAQVLRSGFRYYLSRVLNKARPRDFTPPPKRKKMTTTLEPDQDYLHFGNIAQIYDCRTGTTGFYSRMAEVHPMKRQVIDASFLYYRGRVIRKMTKKQ